MNTINETLPDWHLLTPHRPLAPGEATYAPPPSGGGDLIAALVAAERQRPDSGETVLVEGPIGIGKSTEVARAAELLAATHVACLVQIDRMANMQSLSVPELLGLITQRLLTDARDKLHIQLPRKLREAADYQIAARNVAEGLFFAGTPSTGRTALEVIAHTSRRGRIVLLIDGLEKLPPGAATDEAFGALGQMSDLIDLVVVSPRLASARSGEHGHPMRPLDVRASAGQGPADVFLREIITRRLPHVTLPPTMTLLLAYAAAKSGGIPRTFLQIVAAAGTLARVSRGAVWPDVSDMQDAITAQESSLQRILLPGDATTILAATKTAGRELDPERRERLLAQGILLERTRGDATVLEVHPLVGDMLGRAQARLRQELGD